MWETREKGGRAKEERKEDNDWILENRMKGRMWKVGCEIPKKYGWMDGCACPWKGSGA